MSEAKPEPRRVLLEIMSSVRERRSRETSPDRARAYVAPKTKTFRKVQVIYYLSRNGQLEHPHFMEVSHLINQPLRLKDVMDRLSVLRGRAVTSLYSWSCKRTYKNGYVWNDLAENDVIYPAEGVEYVLKGSELVESCTEHFQQPKLTPSRRIRKSPPPSMKCQNHHHNHHIPKSEEEMESIEDDDNEEEQEEAEILEDKGQSRCSRGVSTEELNDIDHHQQQQQASVLHLGEVINISPSSSSSSEKTNRTTITNNPSSNNHTITAIEKEKAQAMKTPSFLLQLIACGSVAAKGRAGMLMKPSFSSSSSSLRCNNSNGNSGRKSLHREVLSRFAAANRAAEGDEEDVIKYMSENPRFGNLQVEDKEYFSGSIVESMATDKRAADVVSEPSLKRSSSYNEERSRKCVIEEEAEKIRERSVKGKCIPGRKRSTFKPQQQQPKY